MPTNLSSLKSIFYKLHTDKSVPALVDLSKLRDVVKNDFVKKDVYNAKIKNIENKISDIINLGTIATHNPKVNEVKREISSIANLATTTALNSKINECKCIYGS